MKRYHLDRVIGGVEHFRRADPERRWGENYYIGFSSLADETGLSKRILNEMAMGTKVRADLHVIEIIISWATHNMPGVCVTSEDLIQVLPKAWDGPVSCVDDWAKEHPLTKGDYSGSAGRRGQKERGDRRIAEARAYWDLK